MIERNGAKEINKVCRLVMRLKDEDFLEMEGVIRSQLGYSHPFKMATAKKQHELGEHNKGVLDALKNLKDLISDFSRTKED